MEKTILLYSGGLDSYIAWEYLERPKTLYCAIQHKYMKQDLGAIQKTIPETIIDNTLNLGKWEHEDAHIPMRNAFMLMAAANYGDNLCLVVQKGEMTIPDRSPEFFKDFGKWISFLNERETTIFSPFYSMTKNEMVMWYLGQKLPIDKLLETRSCFSPLEKHCGACGACFRRWVAFTNNGIKEEYENNILDI